MTENQPFATKACETGERSRPISAESATNLDQPYQLLEDVIAAIFERLPYERQLAVFRRLGGIQDLQSFQFEESERAKAGGKLYQTENPSKAVGV